MKGRIIGFDPATYKGAINGQDGQRYDFVMQDWRGQNKPHVGAEVDFQPDGGHAKEIFPLSQFAAGSPNPSTFAGFLFSFSGRISRKDYWLKYAIPFVVLYAIAIAIDISNGYGPNNPDSAPVFTALFVLVMIWPSLAVSVKRWHDRGKSGWFVLINFIPIVGAIWSFVELGCLRGTPGDNVYGPDPLAG
jgi:uncharacterized membrane protein YhaH (DUF805 family)